MKFYVIRIFQVLQIQILEQMLIKCCLFRNLGFFFMYQRSIEASLFEFESVVNW